MKYSLVIPAYKEEGRVTDTAARLTGALTPRWGEDYEILFVSDGSPDGTWDEIRALTDPHVVPLGYPDNRGKGHAVRYGMLRARGEFCVFCDCDLAYGIEAVVELFSRLASGEPVCVASRRIHPEGYVGYSRFRRFLSGGYYRMLRLLTGIRASDSQSGLKGFSAEAARRIFSLCSVDGFAFDLEVLMLADRMGFPVSEMPAKIEQNSDSSIRLRDVFRMTRDVLRIKKRIKKLTPADLSKAPADPGTVPSAPAAPSADPPAPD
ncbi:MAG: glycosyltransferase family 2 protein [Clostridia bacterium]|nr:glycosyltransferase family 2 protein [Clostridia bacterium]